MVHITFTVNATLGDGSESSKEITLVCGGKCLGRGGFGVVRQAKLEGTVEQVAVKTSIITQTGETNEVKYLTELKHCNIVNMMYHFRNSNEWDTTEYIVMECMPNTLKDLYNKKHKISQFDIKLYMYQLIRGLAYMHHKDICHRDIKPENILLDPSTGIVKICDFGRTANLSSFYNSPHVGTVTYRAPEMLLGYVNYTIKIDMWSVGCVFVELMRGGTQLFYNSRTPIVKQLIGYFGTPTEYHFPGMEGIKWDSRFDELPKKEAMSWPDIVSPYSISEDAISLCSQLLCYSPSSRLLPQYALAHKFFDELRSRDCKFLANGNPVPPLFNFQPGEFPGDFDILIPCFVKNERVHGSNLLVQVKHSMEVVE